MEASEIIEYLRSNDLTVKVDGNFLELSPPEKITDELIERLRRHKPAIIEELKREERRQRVLQMLEDQPEIQRAFVTDTESDPHNVILMMAIRGLCSFEMHIPKSKYDPFIVLGVIGQAGIQ